MGCEIMPKRGVIFGTVEIFQKMAYFLLVDIFTTHGLGFYYSFFVSFYIAQSKNIGCKIFPERRVDFGTVEKIQYLAYFFSVCSGGVIQLQ